MTVRGPIPANQLGIVLPHEHVFCDLARHSGNPDNLLASIPLCEQEVTRFRRAGGATIVDATTRDIGRNAAALKTISEATGVNIVAATGYYVAKTARDFIGDKTVADLAGEMIREFTRGIDGTAIMPGIIGELGSANHVIQPVEERVLRAAARTHHETGLAITLHSAVGRPAVDQVNILRQEAMPMHRVIVGHIQYEWHRDIDADLAYYQRFLDLGCYLQFDQIGWGDDTFPELEMAGRLRLLIAKGYADRLLLSSDLCRVSFYHANGGFGYDYILSRFVQILQGAGVSARHVQTILVENPAAVLAL